MKADQFQRYVATDPAAGAEATVTIAEIEGYVTRINFVQFLFTASGVAVNRQARLQILQTNIPSLFIPISGYSHVALTVARYFASIGMTTLSSLAAGSGMISGSLPRDLWIEGSFRVNTTIIADAGDQVQEYIVEVERRRVGSGQKRSTFAPKDG